MIWLIALFTILSYSTATHAIFYDKYRPSIYTRIIWFGIAFNNFASVFALHNSPGIKLMATLAVAGNVAILSLSLKKSKRTFGKTELISSILLAASLIIWLTTHAPFLNLTIGLIANFIGGIPTIKKVIDDPRDEHFFFWFWFLLASSLAWISADSSQLSGYLLPAYVVFFDGLMVLLCLRRYLPKKA
ncbi:hypothetical protein A3F05_03095 [Candidatus Saccharibacteria bacterium RIFCSPHIGHO2_12_FULL_47_17]|nr:MAG: hypothetical protein A3F05_03095 [Candidatus Saccharibacteria bacterium RIFCSPHIGHO2_12_FULL_47_17]